ncbi:hypothetical protein AcW1_008013 [Taiwanofungus camphoratus]|nr:hypothetical protein AcV5_008313 [Antrodia cinnamomea]KAI0950806.1 hypothetical protein AcW1_008013 [Antrodia cinnamomea]
MRNLSHTTLRELETQSQDPAGLSHSTAGRASNNYYNNPATQGNSAMTPTGSSRSGARKGSMAPPPPVTASATQSLFSSILAPPPAKRARTIHNPDDPPIPAPTKAGSASTPRKTTKSNRATEGSQTRSKGRKGTRGKEHDRSHEKGKARQNVRGSEEGAADVDIDMKAAATLTSLLLSSRPSISASASSPRSSISAGSDSGSTRSFPQYAQSSTRTVTAATSALSAESSFSMSNARPITPPPSSSKDSSLRQSFSQPADSRSHGTTTPKAQSGAMYRVRDSGTPHPPSDTEAADSLLFLATSPSPVRPTSTRDRDTKDMAAFRALGGGSGLKGRVLFPTHGEDSPAAGSRTLRREDTGSFASTLSVNSDSAGDTIFGRRAQLQNGNVSCSPSSKFDPLHDDDGHYEVPMEPTIIPPTPTDLAPTQLLPAPPSPAPPSRSHTSLRSGSADNSMVDTAASVFPISESKKLPRAPPTPGFNISDFINVSPSPAAATGPPSRLHADIGRRLFEEHHAPNGVGTRGDGVSGSKSGLGAGIDLVKS